MSRTPAAFSSPSPPSLLPLLLLQFCHPKLSTCLSQLPSPPVLHCCQCHPWQLLRLKHPRVLCDLDPNFPRNPSVCIIQYSPHVVVWQLPFCVFSLLGCELPEGQSHCCSQVNREQGAVTALVSPSHFSLFAELIPVEACLTHCTSRLIFHHVSPLFVSSYRHPFWLVLDFWPLFCFSPNSASQKHHQALCLLFLT